MQSSDCAFRVKRLRDYLGYSQRELAEEFQVTSGAIAHWESGLRPVPGPVLKLLAIYENSLNLQPEKSTLISEEALQASRDFFKRTLKILHQEGFSLKEEEKERLSGFFDEHITDLLGRERISFSVKTALARRLIKSLEGSRGLSIKAAQMASFIELGLPPELPRLLGDLQLQAEAIPFRRVQAILESAYGNVDGIFRKISSQPLSVTSLAQLHRATLVNGDEVVLKIKHPEIVEVLQGQFKRLSVIALLGQILGHSVKEVLEEIQSQVFLELDYEREVLNQERFRNFFAHEPRIVIPALYRDLCRENIIVSSYEPGMSFATFAARANAQERSSAALLIASFHSTSIFHWGFMHGDAHPGNFLFRGDQVVFVDFGRIFEIDPQTIEKERSLYLAILYKNKDKVFQYFKERDLISQVESFDFEAFWQVLLRQQEHHLTEGTFKITRSYLRAAHLETLHFKHRKQLRTNTELFRAFLVNASLWSLFADLEAEAPWRAQALKILNRPPLTV